MATVHTRGTQVAHDTIIPMSTRSVLGPHGVSDLVAIAMAVMGDCLLYTSDAADEMD